MSIAKTLDLSIKHNETNGQKEDKFYFLNGCQYDNYMDNDSWSYFIDEMKTKYPPAFYEYGEGSGDELGIKKVGKYPPKMASYGSSSRMIYLLSRDIPGFCFEKKLPTTVGGIANMDGYLQGKGIQFYVEAKCREPYSPKSYIIDRKYEPLYRYIDKNESVKLNCDITVIDEDKMQVQFIANGVKITAFDIKQMISHLLGIATEKLNHPTEEKISFLYLLYNPSNIQIVNPKHEIKILAAYQKQVDECHNIPFTDLFKAIVEYLHNIKNIGTATNEEVRCINQNFSFEMCDQVKYKEILSTSKIQRNIILT